MVGLATLAVKSFPLLHELFCAKRQRLLLSLDPTSRKGGLRTIGAEANEDSTVHLFLTTSPMSGMTRADQGIKAIHIKVIPTPSEPSRSVPYWVWVKPCRTKGSGSLCHTAILIGNNHGISHYGVWSPVAASLFRYLELDQQKKGMGGFVLLPLVIPCHHIQLPISFYEWNPFYSWFPYASIIRSIEQCD